jgi:hypothetical protein
VKILRVYSVFHQNNFLYLVLFCFRLQNAMRAVKIIMQVMLVALTDILKPNTGYKIAMLIFI